MNSRAITLSLIIAGFAMFMVYSYMEGREAEFKKTYGTEKTVVVAKVDIQEFDPIDDQKVTTTKVPSNFLAPGYFSKSDEVFNTIATGPILKGEQITRPRVTFPGESTGLARQVTSGKRAVSVTIDESRAVSKLLKPGDRVDVLSVFDYAGGRKDLKKVKTILQDVLILSTGLQITNEIPVVGIKNANEIRKLNLRVNSNFSTITLELDPYQAQKLLLLMQESNIYLSLRNNDDKQIVRIKGTRYFDLLDEDAPEAKAYFLEKIKEKNLNRGKGGT